jgi:hypothetical protein
MERSNNYNSCILNKCRIHRWQYVMISLWVPNFLQYLLQAPSVPHISEPNRKLHIALGVKKDRPTFPTNQPGLSTAHFVQHCPSNQIVLHKVKLTTTGYVYSIRTPLLTVLVIAWSCICRNNYAFVQFCQWYWSCILLTA